MGLSKFIGRKYPSISEMMWSCNCLPRMSKIPTCYNIESMHHIFNLRDTEVIVCTILIILKRADTTLFLYISIYKAFITL
jgi:hypothetical protein